jgi:hypothetical protein
MTCAHWQKVIDGNLIFSALGPGICARFLYHSKTWKAYRPTNFVILGPRGRLLDLENTPGRSMGKLPCASHQALAIPAVATTPSALEEYCDPTISNLYDAAQEGEVPDTAIKASLGCGDPTALAELKPGETALDLGSGGGIDVGSGIMGELVAVNVAIALLANTRPMASQQG